MGKNHQGNIFWVGKMPWSLEENKSTEVGVGVGQGKQGCSLWAGLVSYRTPTSRLALVAGAGFKSKGHT